MKLVTYNDLLDSKYSMSYFANLCGVSSCKIWKKQGVPKKYQSILFTALRLKKSEKNITVSEKNITDSETIIDSCINDLENENAPLLYIGKVQAACPENSQKFRRNFSLIKPYEPVKISIGNKQLVFDSHDLKTYVDSSGELFEFSKSGKNWVFNPPASFFLSDRFSLQSVSRSLLMTESVSTCMRNIVLDDVAVRKSLEFNSVFFSGLMTCGSIWHCSVCAAKITERRRLEVKQAFDLNKAAAGLVSFCTRTVPHSDFDSLESVKERFREAETSLKGRRRYKRLMNYFGVFGSIKVFEITTTNNGWHLHVHEIYFHDKTDFNVDDNWFLGFQRELFPEWEKSALKAGFQAPSMAHGLQVQNGDFAADYIAKWGTEPKTLWSIDNEITKGHLKKSFRGLSPFDLLRQYRDTNLDCYAELFIEYAIYMKGVPQLGWSRGLKNHFLLDDKTDDSIASEMDDTALVLGYLNREDWKFILKNDYRALIITLGKEGGWSAISDFLGKTLYSGRSQPDRFSNSFSSS